MKLLASILSIAFIFVTAKAEASRAISFSCIGTEEYASDPQPVKFNVYFADWVRGAGYTSITAKFTEYEFSPPEMDLTKFGQSSDCKGGSLVLPTESEAGNGKFSFFLDEGNCGGVPSLVIKATCYRM